MEEFADVEASLQQWAVPSDVRDALRRIADGLSRQGVPLVGHTGDDVVSFGVAGKPAAVFFSSSRVSAALDPADAERAQRADSALGLDKDSATSWLVHCRYGRLDSSRLNAMAGLMSKALGRYAPPPPQRSAPARAPRKRSAATAKAPAPRRSTAAAQEERREAAAAAIPRCPVPGCNLPMVGGSCGFHD